MSSPTSSAPIYAIRGVWDFLTVPEDRLDDCLREFKIALGMARGALGLLDAASKAVNAPIGWKMSDTFTWIDDDERTAGNGRLLLACWCCGALACPLPERPVGSPAFVSDPAERARRMAAGLPKCAEPGCENYVANHAASVCAACSGERRKREGRERHRRQREHGPERIAPITILCEQCDTNAAAAGDALCAECRAETDMEFADLPGAENQ